MSLLSAHFLGFEYAIPEGQLPGFAIPHDLRDDIGWLEYSQLERVEHIPAVHTIRSDHAWERHIRERVRGSCEMEGIREEVCGRAGEREESKDSRQGQDMG